MMTVSVLQKWAKAAVEVVGGRGFLLPVFSEYPNRVAAFAAFNLEIPQRSFLLLVLAEWSHFISVKTTQKSICAGLYGWR